MLSTSTLPNGDGWMGKRSSTQGPTTMLAEKYKNNNIPLSGNNKNRPEYVRGSSRDNVRRIVEKEGKTARNLVAYSVPPSEESQHVSKRKKSKSHKYRSANSEDGQPQSQPATPTYTHRGRTKSKKQTGSSTQNGCRRPKSMTPQPGENGFLKADDNLSTPKQQTTPERACKTAPTDQSETNSTDEKNSRESKSEEYKERVRKAIEQGAESTQPYLRSSSGSSMQSQKSLRARYWSYLFENFHRSVDEIYSTCENDESIIECQEVMLMLDVCKRDFEALIHRLELFTRIEASDVRPQSLAWEVRKQMSPGKCQSPTVNSVRSPSPAAARYLNFGPPVPAKFSWADRVRGFSTKPTEKEEKSHGSGENGSKNVTSLPIPIREPNSVAETIQEVEDESGWEVVRKGRSKSKSSSLVSSASSSHSVKKTVHTENTKQAIKSDVLMEGKLVNGNITEDENKKLNNFISVNSQTGPLTNGHDNHLNYNGVDSTETEGVNKLPDDHCSINQIDQIDGSFPLPKMLDDGEDNTCILKENTYTDSSQPYTPDTCISPMETYEDITLDQDFINTSNDIDHISDSGQSMDGNLKPFEDSSMDYLYGLSENEIMLTEQNERALATVIAEEKTLTKELEEEALKEDDQDDDISSERDYTATEDGQETPKDVSDELPLDSSASFDDIEKPLSWDEICAQYDREHDNPHKFSWGDRMEMMDSVRKPGRALELHQKLSSPSRRKSRSESVKRSEERMARAERRRLRLLVEKCERLRDLSVKVQKVRELKDMLIAEKERNMVDQMRRAEINRQIALQEKIKKAQEEELKVNEIAFINTLEAQNRKIEVQEKQQVSEARLQDLVDERQRRKEGKHAKEEAAQERRRALEQERLARLQEIKQKRGDQAVKWQKERYEREKAREELAKEKQRERDMKVAARNEAIQHASEELLKRIELKHIESTRRHEQRIEEVKEKSRAASSSRHATVEDTPSSIPYEKLKKCTLCDVEIASDVYMVSHLKGPKHRAAIKDVNKKITDAEIEVFSSRYIKEAEPISMTKIKEQDDRAKARKKRAKKIKARMTSKGKEYENVFLSNAKTTESVKQGRLQKCIKDINKVLQAHSNGPWPANKVAMLDKILSEISRSLEDRNLNDQKVFCQLGGLAVLSRVLLLWDTSMSVEKLQKNMVVPPKIIKHASESIGVACSSCNDNCLYMLHSNKVSLLVDLLAFRLKVFSECHLQEKQKDPGGEQIIGDTTLESKSDSSAEITESVLVLFQQDDAVTLSIIKTLGTILKEFQPKWPVKEKKSDSGLPDLHQRLIDLVSYIACSDILLQLINMYRNIQGPFEDANVISVINTIINMFQQLIFCIVRLELTFTNKKDDMSLISETMKNSEAFGLIALMYSLLHQGCTTRISPSPLPLAESTMALLTAALKTLNILALVNLTIFQNTVASEGTSLQYRSVISYLLRYTCIENHDELLHEVILSLGYFTALNEENQVFIQAGRAPSLLQQLCTLPFKYFSDPKLKNILFPTVICICYKNNENIKIVAQDVSPTLLAIYLESMMKEKQDNPVIIDDMDQRSTLDLRFPRSYWEEAKVYFTEPETETETEKDNVQS